MDYWVLFGLAISISSLTAYLLGSINFAIIITKIYSNKDIRDYGSKNAGMTNVLRSVGKKAAILTLIGDILKGVMAVIFGYFIFKFFNLDCPTYIKYIIGFFALIGHSFPIFHKFKGGKGIAVSAGVSLSVSPVVVIFSAVIFGLIFRITKTVSIAAISGCILYPISVLVVSLIFRSENAILDFIVCLIFSVFIIFMHKDNIKRIIKGTENKFEKK